MSRGGALVVAGLSHHTAPVAVREPLAAACDATGAAALRAAVNLAIGPAVVLATCSRLEVYAWAARTPARAVARLVSLLAAHAGVRPASLRPHAYRRTGLDAVRHLIRVTSGLDSLALGEAQIIGQVRDAFLAGAGDAALGPELHFIFQHAIEGARRVRQDGGLGRHPSVAAIAVHVAGQELGGSGGLRGRDVAVLGAGVTGKAAARALAAAGVARIRLLNRSLDRARALADGLALGDRAVPGDLDELPAALAACDAVVCATAATRPVLLAAAVKAALPLRAGRPLVLVDIAVPRDVEPEVRALPGVRLLDLDGLEERCALDPRARRHEVDRIESTALAEAVDCLEALRQRRAAPDIVALRRRAAAVREEEWRRFSGRLSDLTPRERAAVQQLTHAIVQKLLHHPTVALRRAPGGRERAALLQALIEDES
jgi:glutamyl-tRNA reductase